MLICKKPDTLYTHEDQEEITCIYQELFTYYKQVNTFQVLH